MTARRLAGYCARCGEVYASNKCPHHGTYARDISAAEAERVRARYALGKRSNPDHDTTSYRDAAYDNQDHDRSPAT